MNPCGVSHLATNIFSQKSSFFYLKVKNTFVKILHVLGHPPPVSSRVKEYTIMEISIADVIISAIRII
ncbi:MAG: hypothetical protein KGD68_05050 [Candidatus Lokiarchaeota archaeon]|nr:hypothetical protein [Candidatus Lokiarchaeota archaeon]